MKSYIDDEGRWHHKFGASWLKTADTCLERARQEHTGEMPKIESDAACVGTAMHLAAEVNISSGGLSLPDTLEIAQDEFTRLMALDGSNGDPDARHKEGVFRWVKYDERQARKLVTLWTTQWWTHVLPTLNLAAHTEWEFTVPLHEDDERVIELTGCVDYRDGMDLKDWKTSGGGEYKPWEYKRWGLQPSVYTYAARHEFQMEPDPTFEYVVMLSPTKRNAEGVQRFTVERDRTHWTWLTTKCVDIAIQIEHDVPSWPKNDNHALCSPLWCPAWGTCKGAALGPNPFDQDLKGLV